MKTGPGSGFEMTKNVARCGCEPATATLPPYFCAAHNRPLDKPENYSPHTSVSDYLPPRDAGVRKAVITPGPVDGDGRAVDPLYLPLRDFACTCRTDTHAICRLHPLRITDEIDYSKFPLPEATDDEWHAALARSLPVGDARIPFGAKLEIHTGKRPDYATTLPTDPAARKNMPITSGVLDYFPAAIAEVAKVSYIGNEKHNPGQDLHHARGKSMDHADCIARHLIERGTIDTVKLPDGREFKVRHSAYVAWRALALLQEELEAAGAPQARGAR